MATGRLSETMRYGMLAVRYGIIGERYYTMCGRFALVDINKELARAFDLSIPKAAPRYNIAPTQQVMALVHDPEAGGTAFQSLFWGLVPFWAKDKSLAMRCINARAETAYEKPTFRAAFRHRRCLVPATGFYEWKREGRAKTPFYFSPADSTAPLALAGLWENWTDGTEHLRSLSILTTAANAVMSPIHDRMPVIIQADAWRRWVDPAVQNPWELTTLLTPCDDAFLMRREVGTYVNNARHEGEACIAPM